MEVEGMKVFKKVLDYLIICTICFLFGCLVGYNYNTTPPVEEIVEVDSLIKVNDSIKLKVEHLDSIKNAKIIEVQTLDNDSTIKLFYELIGK